MVELIFYHREPVSENWYTLVKCIVSRQVQRLTVHSSLEDTSTKNIFSILVNILNGVIDILLWRTCPRKVEFMGWYFNVRHRFKFSNSKVINAASTLVWCCYTTIFDQFYNYIFWFIFLFHFLFLVIYWGCNKIHYRLGPVGRTTLNGSVGRTTLNGSVGRTTQKCNIYCPFDVKIEKGVAKSDRGNASKEPGSANVLSWLPCIN